MTLAEWASLSEDEPGELVDGRLVEEEVPDLVHESVVSWLIRLLGNWIVPQGGFVFGSEAKFAINDRRGRKPDLSVYLPGTKGLARHGPVRVPPHIMVEVVSPTPRDGRRDRIDKPDDYARFGVSYYWILDPEAQSLEIFELGRDRRYVRALGAAEGVIAAVPGCDGLVLDLDALWAEIGRLPVGEAD
jgi:Uma2 family endonuclease